MTDGLEEYHEMRDADRTPEPDGGRAAAGNAGSRFVIQQHAASSDHFDLRLEQDGVLVSWAIPKGPSTDPREKRLATRTEDHPLEYADFEGTIPQGEYGAGSVIVWDAGTWENLTSDDEGPVPPGQALQRGHLTFAVDGHKLHGAYTLHRFRDDADDWLLVKRDDDGADARRRPTSTEPESVLSGRTVDEIPDDAEDPDS